MIGKLVTKAVRKALKDAETLGAEVLVPRLGLPGRILAIRDDTVEVEVLGRRVHMPLRELEGATRPTSAERRKRCGLSMLLLKANAVSAPMPGTVIIRRVTSSWRAAARSCRS